MSVSFKPKVFLRPETKAEFSLQLREFGEKARIIAGGTGIYEIAHRGLISDVEALIDISGLGLSYVMEEPSRLKIGAATTMSTMWNSVELTRHRELSAVTDALKAIQPLQVKNVATIAGAICTALPFFDLPVALLCLDARAEIFPDGKKTELSEFLKGYFSIELESGEFVQEIEIPLHNIEAKCSSAFQKFSLTGDDWAIINCAASIVLDDLGKIIGSNIVFGGGVGEKPVRATKTEAELKGLDRKDEASVGRIFEESLPKEIEPISDIRSSAEYRIRLAKVLGRRTVMTACNRIISDGDKN